MLDQFSRDEGLFMKQRYNTPEIINTANAEAIADEWLKSRFNNWFI